MNRLDNNIRFLLGEAKAFVKKGKRLIKKEDDGYYEPPPDQSHFWAWLKGAVNHVADVVQDIEMTPEEEYEKTVEAMQE